LSRRFVLDLRYALRLLRRNPGFSAVAVLVLALAIGVNTAAFGLVDALLFKRLPVRAPDAGNGSNLQLGDQDAEGEQ
jgi:hypothetical protein